MAIEGEDEDGQIPRARNVLVAAVAVVVVGVLGVVAACWLRGEGSAGAAPAAAPEHSVTASPSGAALPVPSSAPVPAAPTATPAAPTEPGVPKSMVGAAGLPLGQRSKKGVLRAPTASSAALPAAP